MKKSSAASVSAPVREPLPKIVSIEMLRARREKSALGEANRSGTTGPAARSVTTRQAIKSVAAEEATRSVSTGETTTSVSTDDAMSESERERLLEELRAEFVDLPDVRLDKVIEARTRIARGYYDSERVRLDILGAMLEEERGPSAPTNASRIALPTNASKTESPSSRAGARKTVPTTTKARVASTKAREASNLRNESVPSTTKARVPSPKTKRSASRPAAPKAKAISVTRSRTPDPRGPARGTKRPGKTPR